VSGATLTAGADGAVLASGKNPDTDTYILEAKTPLRDITGIRIEALPDPALPGGGPGRDYYGNFMLQGVTLEAGASSATLAEASGSKKSSRILAPPEFNTPPRKSNNSGLSMRSRDRERNAETAQWCPCSEVCNDGDAQQAIPHCQWPASGISIQLRPQTSLLPRPSRISSGAGARIDNPELFDFRGGVLNLRRGRIREDFFEPDLRERCAGSTGFERDALQHKITVVIAARTAARQGRVGKSLNTDARDIPQRSLGLQNVCVGIRIFSGS